VGGHDQRGSRSGQDTEKPGGDAYCDGKTATVEHIHKSNLVRVMWGERAR